MTVPATFEGSDVDGLDRVAQECNQAAQVVNEVKIVCEAIVAAASIFGPFGAAFISYLKTVVIPWLTKIEEALKLFSQVLSARSQAQRTASSAASLPSYTTPANLPAANTSDYPVLPAQAATSGSLAWGLIHYRVNANGDLTDVTLGGDDGWAKATSSVHLDYSQPGQISALTSTDSVRLGAANDPLVSVTADSNGNVDAVLGTPHLTGDAAGTVTPTYNAEGQLVSVVASGAAHAELNGIPLLRAAGSAGESFRYDAAGQVSGVKDDVSGTFALGPGSLDKTGESMLPAGVEAVPELPDGASAVPTLHAAQASAQFSTWTGSFGSGDAYSVNAHTPELTGGLGFGDKNTTGGGAIGTLGAAASLSQFQGVLHSGDGHTVAGVAGGVDVSAGYSGQLGGAVGTEQYGGYYTVGAGAKGGLGGSFYALDRDGEVYVGGSGEVAELDVKAGGHAEVPK